MAYAKLKEALLALLMTAIPLTVCALVFASLSWSLGPWLVLALSLYWAAQLQIQIWRIEGRGGDG